MKTLLAALLLAAPCWGAEIVGPLATPTKVSGITRAPQNTPPLITLRVLDDDGKPITGKIVKWVGPIGEGKIAQPCGDGLFVSLGVIGTHSFTAVIVPPAVTKPEDIEIVEHQVIVYRPDGVPPPDVTPPDNPPPPDDPPPPPGGPLGVDYAAKAREWLATVPKVVRDTKIDPRLVGGRVLTQQQSVSETFIEVGKAAPAAGAYRAVDLLLTTGLAGSFGRDAEAWRQFALKADEALEACKAAGATIDQYGAILVQIGVGCK